MTCTASDVNHRVVHNRRTKHNEALLKAYCVMTVCEGGADPEDAIGFLYDFRGRGVESRERVCKDAEFGLDYEMHLHAALWTQSRSRISENEECLT